MGTGMMEKKKEDGGEKKDGRNVRRRVEGVFGGVFFRFYV